MHALPWKCEVDGWVTDLEGWWSIDWWVVGRLNGKWLIGG